MKIVYRGTPPAEKVYVGSCSKCLSELEAKATELTEVPGDPRDGGIDRITTCPVCGHTPVFFSRKRGR